MLTDAQIKAATSKDRAYKLADAKGLYLYVTTKGAKSWRYKYRRAGKEYRLTFGLYPRIGCDRARFLRDQARVLIDARLDPRIALGIEEQKDAAALLAGSQRGGSENAVYFIRAPDGLIKIGVSGNVRRRLAQLQLGFDHPLTLLGTMTGGFATEGMLHRLFVESRTGGEWFAPSMRLLEFIDENAEINPCL